MEQVKKPVKPPVKQAETMFESLLMIQKQLLTVGKNKKGFKGKYADIEAVWEAIRILVNSNGFVVRHTSSKEGVTTIAMHRTGEFVDSFIPFSEKTDPQERGKEITYAKRYNIGEIFNVIVADEDNDANKRLRNYDKNKTSGELAAKKLMLAKTAEEARKVYESFSPEERKTDEVVDAIGEIKVKFSLN